MVIIDGKITSSAEHGTLKVIVNWYYDEDFWWKPEQNAYAYMASGFRIDFQLAQLGSDFENIHLDTIKQMAAAMADIAGALWHAIYFSSDKADAGEDNNPDEDWPDKGEFWFSR